MLPFLCNFLAVSLKQILPKLSPVDFVRFLVFVVLVPLHEHKVTSSNLGFKLLNELLVLCLRLLRNLDLGVSRPWVRLTCRWLSRRFLFIVQESNLVLLNALSCSLLDWVNLYLGRWAESLYFACWLFNCGLWMVRFQKCRFRRLRLRQIMHHWGHCMAVSLLRLVFFE